MIASDVEMGPNVSIPQPGLVNLYGCRIGGNTRIGAFVEVQRGAVIGSNCKISSHTFICDGVTIEDGVFVGHGVMFINDTFSTGGPARGEHTREVLTELGYESAEIDALFAGGVVDESAPA